ncbi:MAG: phospholipase domain-containing protein, partial [Sphingobium sp.]
HPSTSSPVEGADFTSQVLDALTSNPDVWASTVFFQTFDENDGLFDHLPPAAPPSYNPDGTMAGKATLDLAGHYFDDHEDKYTSRDDTTSGTTRPWGLGPRVPMYVVSPWSKGGWVSSEVFDHTSVGQFLEARFGVTIPAISPWHRAVCGDLTSCFDFAGREDAVFPKMPDVSNSSAVVATHMKRPKILPPRTAETLFQEAGIRRSRALPYVLHVDLASDIADSTVRLDFINEGSVGAVFHVYDRLHLDRIPRRYTVEAGKALDDSWDVGPEGRIDLWVLGPNGFLRHFTGSAKGRTATRFTSRYDSKSRTVSLNFANMGGVEGSVHIGKDAYRSNADRSVKLAAGGERQLNWPVAASDDWYDLVVTAGGIDTRLAGRMERSRDGVSDPLMGQHV